MRAMTDDRKTVPPSWADIKAYAARLELDADRGDVASTDATQLVRMILAFGRSIEMPSAERTGVIVLDGSKR